MTLANQPDSNSTDVAANCQLVANATLPATWQDPVTGKKLYNEAYILGMSLKTGMHEPAVPLDSTPTSLREILKTLQTKSLVAKPETMYMSLIDEAIAAIEALVPENIPVNAPALGYKDGTESYKLLMKWREGRNATIEQIHKNFKGLAT